MTDPDPHRHLNLEKTEDLDHATMFDPNPNPHPNRAIEALRYSIPRSDKLDERWPIYAKLQPEDILAELERLYELSLASWAPDFDWIVNRCKGAAWLSVNEHRSYHDTVEGWLAEDAKTGTVDPGVLAEMVRLDRVASVQAYPHTSVSFYIVHHHDIATAAKQMRAILEQLPDD